MIGRCSYVQPQRVIRTAHPVVEAPSFHSPDTVRTAIAGSGRPDWTSPNTPQATRDHPVCVRQVAILDRAGGLPVMRYLPSSVNQRGHAMLGGGDPGRVTLSPDHPKPVQRVGRR